MVSDAYIAGFFDGEGHVSIPVKRSDRSGKIMFTQKPRYILDLILETYPGGSIKKYAGGCHELIYNTRKALPIVNGMIPHSVVKKVELEAYLREYSLFTDKRAG